MLMARCFVLSVCNMCVVAKLYTSSKCCLRKQIQLPGHLLRCSTSLDPYTFILLNGSTSCSPNTYIVNCSKPQAAFYDSQ